MSLKIKAQSWSIDIMIGAGIFILGLVIFFYIIEHQSETDKLKELVGEGEKISGVIEGSALEKNPCTFVIGNKIDEEKLIECVNNYNQTKLLLTSKKDFCIFFEDSEGNIINMSSLIGKKGLGFGLPDTNYTIIDETGKEIGFIPCSE